jgi:hypothetical protein
MSKEKIALRFTEGEDGNDILTPRGKLLCSIHRDDDSFAAVIKLARALGFRAIWNDDGTEIEI